MPKYFKKYNQETKQWEVITLPYEVSDPPSHDTEVIVTNVNYSDGTENTNLSDTLTVISDDINELRRNVSWLAEHGGGGGGGGTGPSSGYEISVAGITPNSSNVAYVTFENNSFSFTFQILNATTSERFEYSVLFDNKSVKTGSTTGGRVVNVTVSDISSTVSTHSLYIAATDPYGMSVTPYSVSVVEQSISISMDKTSFSVPVASKSAVVNIGVKNSLRNSQTTLVFENLRNTSLEPYTETFLSSSTTPYTKSVYWTKICPNATAGSTYTFRVTCEVTIPGTSEKLTSNSIVFYATVSSSDVISIAMTTIADKEDVDTGFVPEDDIYSVSINEILSFSFTPYKTGANEIYYAVKMVAVDNDYQPKLVDGQPIQRLLLGNYYDENLKNDGATGYRDNTPPTSTGSRVTCSWYANNEDYVGNVLVYIKCWTSETVFAEKIGVFKLNLAGDVFIGFQNPDNCCFARWGDHEEPMTSPDADKWVSNMPYHSNLSGDIVRNNVTMDIYNTNGTVNGYLTNSLRLQSNAYAKVNLSSYMEEMATWYTYDSTAIDNPCEGFTISITFKADELPDETKTVFMFGKNFEDGTLNEGMRIDIGKIYWYAGGTKLEAPIRENIKTTVDFVYVKNNGDPIIKIYVNGIITQARNAKVTTLYDNIYLAYKGNVGDLSNINIYDFSIFGNVLEDTQLAINAKNAKIADFSSEEVTADYIKWKNNNMFYVEEVDIEGEMVKILRNRLYEDGVYLDPDFATIASIATIPVLYIQSAANGGFTKSYFLNTTTNENVTGEENAKDGITIGYYDPNSGKETITINNVKIGIQGTSSTNYRSKNLEMYLCGLADGATEENQYQLFQPKADWFPEREFTLKADVMDSSHANNAVFGAWINRCGNTLFEPNPAQQALSKIENRPHDLASDGTYLKNDDDEYIYQTEPTVKHTIEGFPVIVIAKFADEEGYDGRDTFLGIYSFNLGRYSHYNLGMRFLKAFTRRSGTAWTDEGTPALITKYNMWPQNEPITYQNGSFKPEDVYAYEFDATADENNNVHPTWSQEDVSVLRYIGKFRYNGATAGDSVPDNAEIWRKLSQLFAYTACYPPTYNYYIINSDNQYELDPSKQHIMSVPEAVDGIKERLNIANAAAYFVLAVGHGLTDSLGKNLTLRTWNGNDEKPFWWTAFYDMDTALGLNNTGAESIKSDAYIDAYENKGVYQYMDEHGQVQTVNSYYALPTTSDGNIITDYSAITWDSSNGPNDLIITRNYSWSQFSSYTSKIWNILRTTNEDGSITQFRTMAGDVYKTYEENWKLLRQNYLTSSDVFTDLMANQMGDCGEMVYNADYNFKYLSKYKKAGTDVETYGDIDKLHGNRVEYVRKWLQERINFFDGVFDLSTDASVVSPYISNTSIYAAGKEKGYPEITVRTSCPFIFVAGLDANKKRYFIPANTDVDVTLISWNANGGKQFQINGNTVLTKLDGLYRIKFQQFESGTQLPRLSEINIANSTLLNNQPINFEQAFTYNEGGYLLSNINTINLSNTEFSNGGSFNVRLYNNDSTPTVNFDKLNYVDISNSCVTSLILPKVPLSYLNIRNSRIATFELTDQPMLSTLSFDGCTNLTTVNINNCDGLTGLTLSGLTMLETATIRNCKNLQTLKIVGNTNLTSIKVEYNNALTAITVQDCTNENLNIDVDIENDTLLELNFKNVLSNSIKLPSDEYLGNVTALTLVNCANLTHITYGDNEVLKYENEDVLDLRPFTSLNVGDENGLDVTNMFNLKYVRFRDDDEHPFKIYAGMFSTTEALTRMFGSISIEGNSVFMNCTNLTMNGYDYDYVLDTQYYDNDDMNITSIEPSGEMSLKITIDSDNLSKCFSNTKCTILDVYYILSKCDNVKNMSEMFGDCTYIGDGGGIRNREIFKHCTKVTNTTRMFIDCDIDVWLFDAAFDEDNPDVCLYNGTFSPLKSLVNMGEMFDGCTVHAECWWNGLFNSLGEDDMVLPLEEIRSFNPEFLYETSANNLLRSLPNLKTIVDSFNYTEMISFVPEEGTDECRLFYNNTKLESVRESFRGMMLGHENSAGDTLKNIFGGDNPSDTEHFPQKLKEISRSFTFVGSQEEDPWIELPLDNNFFSKVSGTLTAITSDENDKTFSGLGLRKYIDTPNNSFPFDIFSDCTKLVNIEYFFKDLIFDGQSENVVLPGRLFENCTRLKGLKGCFAETKFKYELEPGGFIPNTALTDVSYMFAGTSENAGLYGGIPYKLFYFGDTRKNCVTSIGVTQATFDTLSSYVSTVDEDGNVTLTGITVSEIPQTTFSGEQYRTPITRITNIEGAFSTIRHHFEMYENSFNLNGVLSESDFEDCELIIENKSYCPIKYTVSIVNENIVLTKNPLYNPYKYMWNIYAYDGNGDAMYNMITSSALYAKLSDSTSDVYGLLPLADDEFYPEELKSGYLDVVNGTTGQYINGGEAVNDRKYTCPPDILRYCDDVQSLNVTYLFEDSNALKGSIPEMMFYPLSNVTSVRGVFKGVYMLPYKWPVITSGVLTEGVMYPPNLFNTLSKLNDISELFKYGRVWGGTKVTGDLFKNNTVLNNASDAWGGGKWYDINVQDNSFAFRPFTPDGLFYNNKNLTNVSYMFHNTDLPYIESYVFSTTNNSKINDCSYFMGGTYGIKGSAVPEFWTYPNILVNVSAYGNITQYYDKLSNVTEDIVNRYRTTYFLGYVD